MSTSNASASLLDDPSVLAGLKTTIDDVQVPVADASVAVWVFLMLLGAAAAALVFHTRVSYLTAQWIA